MTETLTGGCQCGAVRFRASALMDNSHVCHCRMCQKAAGNLFISLVGVELINFAWTRGAPSAFRSSEQVQRGFCNQCGTPLFYLHDEGKHISMTIGSFDEPKKIPLIFQLGMEGRLPQVDQLSDLPDYGSTEAAEPELAAAVKATARQHPDYDTPTWPLAE